MMLTIAISFQCFKKLFWLHYRGRVVGQESKGRKTNLKSLEIIWVTVRAGPEPVNKGLVRMRTDMRDNLDE